MVLLRGSMPRNYLKKTSFTYKGNFEGENNPFYGRKHSSEAKRIISNKAKLRKGNINPNYKGGYWKKDIPLYNTYAERINYAEDVRRNPKDKNILQIRCTYCDKWITPSRKYLSERIKVLVNGKTRGEGRLYCSNGCKKACPMFGMRKNTKPNKPATSREVQPELRKLVLKRDNYECQICGNTESELHCHHIDPVVNNPIESADMDNCITYCKKCHIVIHKENKNCINKC